MRYLLSLLAVTVALVASATSGAQVDAPAPPTRKLVPHGYHVIKTYRASLRGGAQPDVVVVSRTRRGKYGVYDDLQVLSWTRQGWVVTFDAQRAKASFSDGPHESNYGAGEGYLR